MEKFATVKLEAALASKKYDKPYTSVPNSKLGNNPIKQQLTRVLEFFGETFNNEDSYITVRAEKDTGAFDRIYLPTVYRRENEEDSSSEPVIRFSPSLSIPLSKVEQSGADIDFDDQELVVWIPGDEEKDEEDMIASFRIFTKDNGDDAPSPMEMKQAYKKGKLVDLLGNEPQMSSSINLKDLEDGAVVTIVEYEERPGQYGNMYFLWDDEGNKYLANTAIKKVLAANPTISKELPASLEILSKNETRNGKIRVNCTLQCSEGAFGETDGIDLDF